MKLYYNVKDLSETMGVSRPVVEDRKRGIQDEIERGRYNEYAISDRLINILVFIDYNKYKDLLNNPRLRSTAPEFNPDRVKAMLTS